MKNINSIMIIVHCFIWFIIMLAISMMRNVLCYQITILSIPVLNNLLGTILSTALIFVIFLLYSKFVFKKDAAYFRFKFIKPSLLLWLFVGFCLPLLVFFFFLLSGKLSYISGEEKSFSVITGLIISALLSAFSASFIEELALRSMVMRLLEKKWNIYIAVIIPSVIFGLFHCIVIDGDLRDVVLLAVWGFAFGGMLSVITAATGNVWNAIGVHALWNTVILDLIQISSPARKPFMEKGVFRYFLDSNNIFFNGGTFGVESSMFGIICCLLLAAATFLIFKRKMKVSRQTG